MTAKEFFDKVVAMREAQKEYFRSRFQDSLRKSKALEAEIDNEIKRVRAIQQERAKAEAARRQGSLFTDNN